MQSILSEIFDVDFQVLSPDHILIEIFTLSSFNTRGIMKCSKKHVKEDFVM